MSFFLFEEELLEDEDPLSCVWQVDNDNITILFSIAWIQIFLFLVVFSSPFSYIKGSLNISAHLSMKIILVDPNLVHTFFGNSFFYPNYGAHSGE